MLSSGDESGASPARYSLIVALSGARQLYPTAADHAWTVVLHALMSIFLSGAVYVLLRDLFARPPIGVENVLGAICGYMIAGIAWGDINALAFVLVPSAYSVDAGVSSLVGNLESRVASSRTTVLRK